MKLFLIVTFYLTHTALSYSQDKPVFLSRMIDGPSEIWYGPFSEGSAVFDVNNNGFLDITSGSYWYEGPDFVRRHHLRDVRPHQEFMNNGGEYPYDMNGNGWLDLISWGWFEDQNIYWYENNQGNNQLWEKHLLAESKNTEFVLFVDLNQNGIPDMIPSLWSPHTIKWIEIRTDTIVSHQVGDAKVKHGIGVGDINGNGRFDIVTTKGWYEMPIDLYNSNWKWHLEFDLGSEASLPIIIHDVNNNGLSDIIYGNAHGYGLYWLEQQIKGNNRTWKRHIIDTTWSQIHTLELADITNNGNLELITGKRLRGHGGKDPGAYEPLGIYWYEIDEKTFKFTKYVITYNAKIGTGMKINVVDIDGDGDLDIVVSGKSGLYILENLLIIDDVDEAVYRRNYINRQE